MKKIVTRALCYLSSLQFQRCSGVSALLKIRANNKAWYLCMAPEASYNATEIEQSPFHKGPRSSNLCKYSGIYFSGPVSSSTRIAARLSRLK